MSQYDDFIDDDYIESLLSQPPADPSELRDILAKGREKKGLSAQDTARLTSVTDPELIEELFTAASRLKRDIYGNRIVFFAPLYITNYCTNDCLYCAFRTSNSLVRRHLLSDAELIEEVRLIEAQGHKRIIAVFGESPLANPEMIAQTVRKIYDVKLQNDQGSDIGAIRRININAAPLDVAGYRVVKEAGIGTFQIFQETYHKKTYRSLHQEGTSKGNYHWRLFGLHRAQEGGIDDVGLGALFGLYNWRFEVVSLIMHAASLEKHFGVGPHTISFPRVEPAFNTPFTINPPFEVSDEDFKKIIAIIRLAVPYTGLILTCRENASLRHEAIKLGVSQIDAGSKIGIGGYREASRRNKTDDLEQFQLGDDRSLIEVVTELMNESYLPSFCTACYRSGRTGEHFMAHAKPGFIKRFCDPNAILTFSEYLRDFTDEDTRGQGRALIAKMLSCLDEPIRKKTEAQLAALDRGGRDLFL
jgi:2-iminoacetate synthase